MVLAQTWLVGVMSVVLALAGSGMGMAIAQETSVEEETGTLTVHFRICPEAPPDGDWYGACHDDPDAYTTAPLAVMDRESDFSEIYNPDETGTLVVELPPGTYSVGPARGHEVTDDYTFCSTLAEPAVEIPFPVELGAGDELLCDVYIVLTSFAHPEPTEEAAPTEEPPAPEPTETPVDEDETSVATEPPTEAIEPEQPVEQSGYPAGISTEPCTDVSSAEEFTAELTPVSTPSGEPIGAQTAMSAATSVSSVDLSFDEILATDHVMAVFDEDNPDMVVACGSIGGVISDDGSLTISLVPVDDSERVGIAYLIPEGDEASGTTGISLFMTDALEDDATEVGP